jgi:hypothetical protein
MSPPLANEPTCVKFFTVLLAFFDVVCGLVNLFLYDPGGLVPRLIHALLIFGLSVLVIAGHRSSWELKHFRLVRSRTGLGVIFFIAGALIPDFYMLTFIYWPVNWLAALGFVIAGRRTPEEPVQSTVDSTGRWDYPGEPTYYTSNETYSSPYTPDPYPVASTPRVDPKPLLLAGGAAVVRETVTVTVEHSVEVIAFNPS